MLTRYGQLAAQTVYLLIAAVLIAWAACTFLLNQRAAGADYGSPIPSAPVSTTTTRTTTTTATTYRSATGHTHTCANGHTWDHQSNPTHHCKVCGLEQLTVDRVSKPVPVIVTAASSWSQLTQYSGCVGGNCPVPQTTRVGILGRIR